MVLCHCKDCQRASGNGHTVSCSCIFKDDQISIDGQFNKYSSVADSRNENIRGFCSTCGARLFATIRQEKEFSPVSAGCADNNSCQVLRRCHHRPGNSDFDTFLPKNAVVQ